MVGVRLTRPAVVAGAILLLAAGCDRSRQENTSGPDVASDPASSTVAEPAASPPSVVTMADYDPRFFDETSHIVADAVRALPPLQREALVLAEYEQLSLEDIARIVDAEVGTVKSRLHRARENLRRMLAPLKPASAVRSTRYGTAG